MSDLVGLLERVKSATGRDRHIDGLVEVEARRQEAYHVGLDDRQRAYWEATPDGWVYDNSTSYIASPFTASIDAALALVERVLPVWGWRGGTCCVSDDCFIFPDFNSPIHGERLKREFPQLVNGVEWSDLTDIDRRPAGNLPLAIIESILTALIAKEPQP